MHGFICPTITGGNLKLFLVVNQVQKRLYQIHIVSFPTMVKHVCHFFRLYTIPTFAKQETISRKESAKAGNSCANDEPKKNSCFWWVLLGGKWSFVEDLGDDMR